jgi:hypothetical protein
VHHLSSAGAARKGIDSEGRMTVMRRSLLVASLAAFTVCNAELAMAQQSGTAAEAKAMFERALVALRASEVTAISEFNDKNNKQFHDRDLYVFCYNMSDGKFTAHPNPALMGTDVRALKFKDDPFGQRAYDTVKAAPEGSVSTFDYEFPRPGTTEPVPKQSFETRLGNQACGVGYYK